MRWTFIELGRTVSFEDILPLADVKADLDVDHVDDDGLIAAHRDAAIQWVEHYTNLRLGLSQLRFISDWIGAGGVTLPFSPVVSVEALRIAGLAVSGFRSISGANWSLLPPSGQSWPSYTMELGAVEADYTVGYAAGAAPALALQGAKAVAAIYYERSGQAEADLKSVEALLFPIRVSGLG
jgi:uncharacterized phiE125 gp8 family phage protein